MAGELERLTASVAKLTDADDSMITLLKGLAQLIRDNANNPAALTALADKVDSEAEKMAAAVTENTTA